MSELTAALEGFHPWVEGGVDPFEDVIGPFYIKKMDNGSFETACEVKAINANSSGSCHGGYLMAFADFSLFAFAGDCFGGEVSGVTVSLNNDFLSAAYVGEVMIGRGEISKETGSMIFARGGLYVGERCVLTFSGVIKKLSN